MKKPVILVTLLIAAGVACGTFFYLNSRPTNLYANLLIGPDRQTQVNFITCGRRIFVDENKDGVAQANEFAGKTMIAPLEIVSADGQRAYKIFASLMFGDDTISDTFPQKLRAQVFIRPGPENNVENHVKNDDVDNDTANEANEQVPDRFSQSGYVVMGKSADDAARLCFDGPLKTNLIAFNGSAIERGREFEVRVEVAVAQLQDDGWCALSLRDEDQRPLFKSGVYPVLTLQYQTAESEGEQGIEPKTETWPVDEFC